MLIFSFEIRPPPLALDGLLRDVLASISPPSQLLPEKEQLRSGGEKKRNGYFINGRTSLCRWPGFCFVLANSAAKSYMFLAFWKTVYFSLPPHPLRDFGSLIEVYTAISPSQLSGAYSQVTGRNYTHFLQKA